MKRLTTYQKTLARTDAIDVIIGAMQKVARERPYIPAASIALVHALDYVVRDRVANPVKLGGAK